LTTQHEKRDWSRRLLARRKFTIMDSGEFAAPDPGDAGVATDSGPVSLEVPAGTSRPIPGDVILTLEDVSKGFRTGPPWRRRTIEVLHELSLQVRAGELVGLVGENGSGKSTLMQLVVGLLGRDSGTIACPPRIGYCPQRPLLWDKLTTAEHFALFGTAYAMDVRQATASARELMEELGFLRFADYRVEQLSGGTRQKLNLALALGDLRAVLGDGRRTA
jgi:ATPase subunit of ABC transporter with duplicated ATPase domains